MIPLALVGVTFRDAPTALRGALLEFDLSARGASRELLDRGIASGIVRIETCARIEWLISAPEPRWAADLLTASLTQSVEGRGLQRTRVHCGHASLVFLLRMAVGLDSVSQGEHAIGRQMLQAFERAHRAHETDRALRLCWRRLAQTLAAAHLAVPSARGGGVHRLAVDHLRHRGLSPSQHIAVFGSGEMGRAVAHSLRNDGFANVTQDSRASLPSFLERTAAAAAVIVCSGAPRAWLTLPPREDAAVVIDVGSPEQIVAASGWERIGLDDLLTSTSATLPEHLLATLESLCATEADALARSIQQPSRAATLRAMSAVRREFLSQTLPALLNDLPAPKARQIEASVGEVMHQLLREARGQAT
jgi:glutamyl-tRNA reductase